MHIWVFLRVHVLCNKSVLFAVGADVHQGRVLSPNMILSDRMASCRQERDSVQIDDLSNAKISWQSNSVSSTVSCFSF